MRAIISQDAEIKELVELIKILHYQHIFIGIEVNQEHEG